jgi:nitrogen fixation protein NifU and related proteins
MPVYTPKLREHFTKPQNVGTLEPADGHGKSGGGEHCPDDQAYVWIRVRNGRIHEIRHKTLGCPVAIATSSMTTVLADGKPVEDAEHISEEQVIRALGGIPPEKEGSVVGPNALKAAIADYRSRRH